MPTTPAPKQRMAMARKKSAMMSKMVWMMLDKDELLFEMRVPSVGTLDTASSSFCVMTYAKKWKNTKPPAATTAATRKQIEHGNR